MIWRITSKIVKCILKFMCVLYKGARFAPEYMMYYIADKLHTETYAVGYCILKMQKLLF